jgi:hypothetical protein
MTTLTDFLLARIAEDESRANLCLTDPVMTWHEEDWAEIGEPSRSHVEAWGPTRVLAECEAKRLAIEAAWGDHERIESEWGSSQTRAQMSAKNDYPGVVMVLALPYADHPDYRAEWQA